MTQQDRVRRIVLVSTVGALAILGAPPAQAAPKAEASRVKLEMSEGAGVKLTFDRRDRMKVTALPGRRTVENRVTGAVRSSATAPPRVGAAASASGSGRGCVRNRDRRGFVIFPPTPVNTEGEGAKLFYNFHLYKQNRARTFFKKEPNEYVAKQLESCAVGGGRRKGDWKLNRTVASMTMFSGQTRIDQKWDVGEEESTANATLSFDVQIKPVSIGASIPVGSNATLTGSIGGDEEEGEERGPGKWAPYESNQVNAIWESSDTTITQGSDDFQGNVGHTLWEMPQRRRVPQIEYFTDYDVHCGKPGSGVGISEC